MKARTPGIMLIAFAAGLPAPAAQADNDASIYFSTALYDEIEAACRPLVPALFDQAKAHLTGVVPADEKKAQEVRQSESYALARIKLALDPRMEKFADGEVAARTQACTEFLEYWR